MRLLFFLFLLSEAFSQTPYSIKLKDCDSTQLGTTEFYENNVNDRQRLEPVLYNNNYYLRSHFQDTFADIEIINSSDLYKRFFIKNSDSLSIYLTCRNQDFLFSQNIIDFVDFLKRNQEFCKIEQNNFIQFMKSRNTSQLSVDSVEDTNKKMDSLKNIWDLKQLEFLRVNKTNLESLVLLNRIIGRRRFLNDTIFYQTYFLLDENLKSTKLGKYLEAELKKKILRYEHMPYLGSVNKIVFKSENLNGKSLNLDDFKGKKIMLNFWATWCGPCVHEMPFIKQIHEENPNLIIIGFSQDEDVEKWEKYVLNENLKWLQYRINNEVKYDFNVDAIPVSILIDENGIFKRIHTGAMNYIEFKKFIED